MIHNRQHRRLPAVLGAITILAAGLGLMACGNSEPQAEAKAPATVVAPESTEASESMEAPTTTEAEVVVGTDNDQAPTTTEPAPTTAPVETVPPTTEAPPPPAPVTYTVVDVVDGDTIDLDNGERVRLVGIDAPEGGVCGSGEAVSAMRNGVLGRQVILESSDEDRDVYGRWLRYVIVDGYDVGGALLSAGLAIPRYNSTDGYGWHPREAEYFAIAAPPLAHCSDDVAPAPAPVPALSPPSDVRYANCDDVRAHGADPIYPGDPGWQEKFDRDNDGVGCE